MAILNLLDPLNQVKLNLSLIIYKGGLFYSSTYPMPNKICTYAHLFTFLWVLLNCTYFDKAK